MIILNLNYIYYYYIFHFGSLCRLPVLKRTKHTFYCSQFPLRMFLQNTSDSFRTHDVLSWQFVIVVILNELSVCDVDATKNAYCNEWMNDRSLKCTSRSLKFIQKVVCASARERVWSVVNVYRHVCLWLCVCACKVCVYISYVSEVDFLLCRLQ